MESQSSFSPPLLAGCYPPLFPPFPSALPGLANETKESRMSGGNLHEENHLRNQSFHRASSEVLALFSAW